MKFDSKQVWLFVILSSFCDENAEALQYVAQGDEDPRSISLERVKLMLGSAHCAALSQFRAEAGGA